MSRFLELDSGSDSLSRSRQLAESGQERRRRAPRTHETMGFQVERRLEASFATRSFPIDGKSLWVGGMGFIGCVDLTRDQVHALACLPERKVDRLQVGRGHVWFQCENRLYRAALQALP